MKRCTFLILFFFFFSLAYAETNSVQPPIANVLVGDSITAAWPWQDLLAKQGIINRGVSGDTSSLILQRMAGILAVKPKQAFLMFGINDFGRGAEPKQVFDNYKRIVKILQNEKIKVIISSTIKCSANQIYLPSEEINRKVEQLNAHLKQLAHAQGIIFIDINEKLSDANGLMKKYTIDGVHLNYEAYKEWAKLLSPLILQK